MRIRFKKNAECPDCLEVKPLLMPVRFHAGTLEVQELPLCVDCRVGWEDNRQWGVELATTLEHALRRPDCAGRAA